MFVSDDILQQLPGLFLIMNKESQFIGSNLYTANLFGFETVDQMLGLRAYDMRCSAVECAADFIDQDKAVLRFEKEMMLLDIHTYHAHQEKILITKKKPWYDKQTLGGVICYCTEIQSDEIVNIIKALTRADQQYYPRRSHMERSYHIGCNPQTSALTEREMDCLFYVIRGKTTQSIATLLQLSTNTVAAYIKSIKRKFGCQTRTQIIEIAISKNLHSYVPESIIFNGLTKFI